MPAPELKLYLSLPAELGSNARPPNSWRCYTCVEFHVLKDSCDVDLVDRFSWQVLG
jgi:hypothetical protein